MLATLCQFSSVCFCLFTSRDERQMNYWGGGDPDSSGCACDLDKSCVDPDFVCNCDKNDNVLREDSGYLTSKDDLPMFGFYAGDTGTYKESVTTYCLTVYLNPHGIICSLAFSHVAHTWIYNTDLSQQTPIPTVGHLDRSIYQLHNYN